MRGDSGKHTISRGGTVGSSRTLFRLANLHRDIRKRNFNRPWPRLTVLLFVTDDAALDKWVDVGEVRVKLTGGDGRDTLIGLTAVSPGVPMTFSGVGR